MWPLNVRGRGIDAVWRTEKGPRPYAIVEAKASVDPSKGLGQLLDEAWDKNESDRLNSNPTSARGGGAGRRGRGGSGDVTRQKNGKVTQMSHGWIESRIGSAVNHESSVLETFRSRKRMAYSRHVLFFSLPQAAAHSEALITLLAGRPVDQGFHAGHEVTREWIDNQIERVVNDRAGVAPVDRGRRR